MRDCMYYFPNAKKLIFKDSLSGTNNSIAPFLIRIIPLQQLTSLIIECHRFSFIQVIELLQFTPNIRTLKFETMPLFKSDDISIQQSGIFRFVSIINNIKNVTFKGKCTFERLKLLVTLCPRVQILTIYTFMKDMESIILFLLGRTNHLVSLNFTKASKHYFRHLNALIKSGKLPRDYILKHINSTLYLWW
jgi:hypothetical protein